MLVSNKYLIGKKCFEKFIVYVNYSNRDIKPILVSLPRSSGSKKSLWFWLGEKHKNVFKKSYE